VYRHFNWNLLFGLTVGVLCWLIGFFIVYDSSLLPDKPNRAIQLLVFNERQASAYIKDFCLIFINNSIVAIIISTIGYITFGLVSILLCLYNGMLLGLIINSFLEKFSPILLPKVLLHVPIEIIAFSYSCSLGLARPP
jgi:uncharacterized membrane protein SpoIIM required for sporulation